MKTKEMMNKLEDVQFLSVNQAKNLAKIAMEEIDNIEMKDALERQLFDIKHANGSANAIFNIVEKYL